MKATLKNYRQSPRKVRLVARSLQGKSVREALVSLGFLTKRAADPLKKLIESAVANSGTDGKDLVVSSMRVDKGVVFKRFRPRARGSASRINKRNAHVTVELKQKENK
ncbi:50S ribosomal protein L22 [Candidatus Nomurabacteria bacterium]|nr:50S ribosomal protein L22 [Candidatus Nomurabacteria bacterium]USN94776.1 MAG: 50S ribosomal protein L22 [Candidatus Nomurabacteria bacterium]